MARDHRSEEPAGIAHTEALVVRVVEWAKKNQKPLLVGTVLIVLAIFSMGILSEFNRKHEMEASNGLFQLEESFKSSPLKGQTEEQVSKLLEFESAHSGTTAAREALFRAAGLYKEAGKTAEALSTYQKIAKETKVPFFKAAAYLNAGALSENLGDLNGALEFYKSALNSDPGSLKNEVILSLGRVYFDRKEYNESKKMLEQLVAQSSSPTYAEAGRKLLDQVPSEGK